METLTYGSGRASGCDSPGLLNVCPKGAQGVRKLGHDPRKGGHDGESLHTEAYSSSAAFSNRLM